MSGKKKLIESAGFKVDEFIIPAFTLHQGEMIRFWVETKKGSILGLTQMEYVVKELGKNGARIWFCKDRIKKSWKDIFRPRKANEYLSRRFGLSLEDANTANAFFDIKSHYEVKLFGFGHRRVFSIICGFQQGDIAAFYNHVLTPHTRDQIMDYAKWELKRGKSAICFDDLQDKPMSADSDGIVNLEVRLDK